MKRGANSSRQNSGFTIVETLIVLVVTGFLFVGIARVWFGSQRGTEFQSAAQEMNSRILQVISDVQNGYFPSDQDFSCGLNGTTPTFTSTAAAQGTNMNCVFLGKAIQLGVNNSAEQFSVLTVAGYRTPNSQTTISDSSPTVVDPTYMNEMGNTNNGLTFVGAKINNTPTNFVALAFLSRNPTKFAVAGGNSGTQVVNLYAIPEATVQTSPAAAKTAIDNGLTSTGGYNTPVTSPALLCFKSGGTANQYATITLGYEGNPLATRVSVSTNNQCL